MWALIKDIWQNCEEELTEGLADMAALVSLFGLTWVMLVWGVLLDLV